MDDKVLEFNFMRGKIVIDLDKCKACESKACVPACTAKIFKLEGQTIALNMDREKIAKGGCTETLACELECQLKGKGSLKILLPMPEFDKYMEKNKNKKGIRA